MKTDFKSIGDFKDALATDTDLQAAFKTDPVEAGKSIQEDSSIPDNWIYRIVVGALGASILIIVLGVIILMALNNNVNDKTIPTILTAIGSAAIGALSGLLAPSPKNVKQ